MNVKHSRRRFLLAGVAGGFALTGFACDATSQRKGGTPLTSDRNAPAPSGTTVQSTTGTVDEVSKLFEAMIAEGLHPGAQLAVYRDGQLLADLVGGVDGPGGKPVTAATLFQIRSCTKALAATVAMMLRERGRFQFDDPVARYWPEFAKNGKGGITIAHIMGHRAGIPDGPVLGVESWGDRKAVVAAIEEMTPVWEPGNANGYHAATYGWVLDEIALRTDGRSISEILRKDITDPLGISDVYIGLPDSEFGRMAKMAIIDPVPDSRRRTSDAINSGVAARLPLSWISGMATARDAAKLMNLLAYEGTTQGRTIYSVQSQVISRTPTNAAGEIDQRLRWPVRWGLGYILGDTPGIYGTPPHSVALGHAGGGASVLWADPERRLAVAFLCNGMLAGGREWERYRRLGDAINRTFAT